MYVSVSLNNDVFTDKLLLTFMFNANLTGQVWRVDHLRGMFYSGALSYFSCQITDDWTALERIDNINTEETFSSSRDGLWRKMKTTCHFRR